MRIPLTEYGRREILIGALFFGVLAVLGFLLYPPLMAVPAILYVGILAFFRDPNRSGSTDAGDLLSPADGTVADIEEVEPPVFLEGPVLRVGVFMSVFNVHVNRMPCSGEVRCVEHHPGAHHDARSGECQMENEHNFVGIETPEDKSILLNQIAGMVARRIVCDVRSGEKVTRGQRFGMVKFGSRLELYVPLSDNPEPRVKVGDKVKAGHDVLVHCEQ